MKESGKISQSFLGDSVKRIGLDAEGLGGRSDIGTAGLPVGHLAVQLRLENGPFVLDRHSPEWEMQRLDYRGDVLIGAKSGIGHYALAMGIEAGGVL